MILREWMIAAAVAILGAAVIWGNAQSSITTLKEDVKDIKIWKDAAIQQMGNMDAKLDLLLEANGVSYNKRRGK